jgi:inorganic pyrophosphatase
MDSIVDVLVETTQGSKHKYEYDHQRRAMRLDRRLYSAVSFPADYGFVAGTEGADGEPLDALVLLEDPTFPGCWVRARVVGVFWIRYDKEGESRREAKLITVAEGDPNFEEVHDLDQLPDHLLSELENFFDVYKMLEPGTSPVPDGYEGRQAALREVEAARDRAGRPPAPE